MCIGHEMLQFITNFNHGIDTARECILANRIFSGRLASFQRKRERERDRDRERQGDRERQRQTNICFFLLEFFSKNSTQHKDKKLPFDMYKAHVTGKSTSQNMSGSAYFMI